MLVDAPAYAADKWLFEKLKSHVRALAIYCVFYNFMRIHKALRVALAIAAGLTDKLTTWEDLIAVMDAGDQSTKRGPYKKRIEKISN